jgi:hypothetical protein
MPLPNIYTRKGQFQGRVPVLGKIALFKMYNDFMERFRTKVEQGQQRKQQQSQNSEDNDDWFK